MGDEYDRRPMHPLERLLNLVILLLETNRPLPFTEIREKLDAYAQGEVNAAKRMFERDKDVLRDLGIPVELVPTDVWEVEEGYVIPKDRYYLPEIEFTPEELSALYVAAHSIGALDEAGQAVRKLQVGAGEGILAGLPDRPLAAGPDVSSERLLAVARAIDERRGVSFDYRPSSGEPGRRRVDPYSLVSRAGQWYLIGLDRDREDVRSFRLSRLQSEPRLEGPASQPPEGFDAREHLKSGPWGVGEPEVEARVALSPDVAWWALRGVAGLRDVAVRGDGWTEAVVPASRGEGFLSWVLSFGPDAEVLGPADLRAAVVERLEAAIGRR
jgi:proteasome accessory factor B